MNDDPEPTADEPVESSPGPSTLQPAEDLWAFVRTAPVPREPPDHLAAFVVRQPDDWALTADVVAFGHSDAVPAYLAWRAQWMLTNPLTTAANLTRLAGWLGAAGRCEVLDSVLADLREEPDAEIPFSRIPILSDELSRLRHRLVEDDGFGHGIVDDTPGSERAGLVRAWPSFGESETISAHNAVRIELVPTIGLLVRIGGEGEPPIAPLGSAEATEAGWRIAAGDRLVELERRDALPLAWLVPGSTRWRVRRVPNAVVWASLLTGFDASIEAAIRHRSAIVVTTRRPIATV